MEADLDLVADELVTELGSYERQSHDGKSDGRADVSQSHSRWRDVLSVDVADECAESLLGAGDLVTRFGPRLGGPPEGWSGDRRDDRRDEKSDAEDGERRRRSRSRRAARLGERRPFSQPSLESDFPSGVSEIGRAHV